MAALVAAFTASSFAELAARYPRAAGAALYVQHGFGRPALAIGVGLLVVLTGVVSAAAMVNAFTGYLQEFLPFERAWVIPLTVLVLGFVAAWGIAESVIAAAIITVIEVGGLLLIVIVGADGFMTLADRWTDFIPGSASAPFVGTMFGVVLAFYAFIGFEDMVDIAEEVREPSRTIPRAILLTLGITVLLYTVLMMMALLTLSPDALRATDAPLAALYAAHTGSEPLLIGAIAVFAILNGALIQIIMASRVLYGLASREQLPSLFRRVDPRTRTPLVATGVIALLILAFALYGRLAGLATATSVFMLTIFALVNLALWRIKGGESGPVATISFPRVVPLAGFVLSGGFVVWELVGLVR
jgi:amino acid transporter